MFTNDFFPTPPAVIDIMMQGEVFDGKVWLEPEAGKCDIVDRVQEAGAQVIACENHKDLAKLVQSKCKLIANDFLTVTSEQVSHIHGIIMNPPFSADEKHILHAWDIAPPGCKIVALCNTRTIENRHTQYRKRLGDIIDEHGLSDNLGDAFTDSERRTNVEISVIRLQKPGETKQSEFDGFFMEDDPEEDQANAIIEYNVVRDLVNRYVAAVRLYDEQLNTGVKMNTLLGSFYGESLVFSCTEKGAPKLRNEFKKDLQKAGWKFIFEKMNMQKYATKGLREDINRFVEQQSNIPFTMRNIYKMLEIVVGTQKARMDKSLEEVFDRITRHTADNKYFVEGWKTNSHFLLPRTFIMPWMIDNTFKWSTEKMSISYNGNREEIDDLQKALCYITGIDYETTRSIYQFVQEIKCEFGQWYYWGFFEIKGFKKGTMHFRFQSEDLWAKFNQHIARIKGYPLFEGKAQTAYQNRQTGRSQKRA